MYFYFLILDGSAMEPTRSRVKRTGCLKVNTGKRTGPNVQTYSEAGFSVLLWKEKKGGIFQWIFHVVIIVSPTTTQILKMMSISEWERTLDCRISSIVWLSRSEHFFYFTSLSKKMPYLCQRHAEFGMKHCILNCKW